MILRPRASDATVPSTGVIGFHAVARVLLEDVPCGRDELLDHAGVDRCADNGAVFTGHYRGHGWVAVERELVALGIRLSHCKPYHPQTCGKVERLHQILKNWLTRQPITAATLAALQIP